MRNTQLGSRIFFGDFALCTEAGELYRREVRVKTARPQEILLLTLLVERAGQKVAKREIATTLWPTETPAKNRLNVLISSLRSRMGDTNPNRRKYISTLADGYCFIHPIQRIERVQDALERQEAERAFRAGKQALEYRTDSSIRKAISLFKKTVELNPSYGLGWVGLADAYIISAIHCVDLPRDAFLKARAAAEEAQRIDPSIPDALVSLAMVRLCHDREWKTAEQMFLMAVSANPKLAYGHNGLALLQIATGRAAEGIISLQQALDHNPLSAPLSAILCHMLCFARRFGEAIETGRRAVLADPESAITHSCLGSALLFLQEYGEALAHFERAVILSDRSRLYLGFWGYACALARRRQEAESVLTEFLSSPRHEYASSYLIGLIQLGLGKQADAIRSFSRACDEGSHWVNFLNQDPSFDKLKKHAGFIDLLGRLGFHDDVHTLKGPSSADGA